MDAVGMQVKFSSKVRPINRHMAKTGLDKSFG